METSNINNKPIRQVSAIPIQKLFIRKPVSKPAKKIDNSTITITFGDCAENHKGMQLIGTAIPEGYSVDQLESIKQRLKKDHKVNCEHILLHHNLPTEALGDDNIDKCQASILVIRDAVDKLFNISADQLNQEQMALDWDKKAYMYGRVVNKNARYNLCYSDISQEPNYAEGKGRIIDFNTLPLLNSIRQLLPKLLGGKADKLQAEGNNYHDINKMYIGYHGDSERRIVVAIRLGANFPLHYQWYKDSIAVGDRLTIDLKHGDMYIMSSKAVGTDWKKKKIPTLRHAAGHLSVLKL